MFPENLESLLDELGYMDYLPVWRCVGVGWVEMRSLGKWRVHVFGKVGGGGWSRCGGCWGSGGHWGKWGGGGGGGGVELMWRLLGKWRSLGKVGWGGVESMWRSLGKVGWGGVESMWRSLGKVGWGGWSRCGGRWGSGGLWGAGGGGGVDVEVVGEVEVIGESGHCEGYGSRGYLGH